MAISSSSFWTLASGTSAGRGAVREELGAVLLPGIDSTGVVSVDACVAVRAWATVSVRSSASGAALDGALCVEPIHWPHS